MSNRILKTTAALLVGLLAAAALPTPAAATHQQFHDNWNYSIGTVTVDATTSYSWGGGASPFVTTCNYGGPTTYGCVRINTGYLRYSFHVPQQSDNLIVEGVGYGGTCHFNLQYPDGRNPRAGESGFYDDCPKYRWNGWFYSQEIAPHASWREKLPSGTYTLTIHCEAGCDLRLTSFTVDMQINSNLVSTSVQNPNLARGETQVCITISTWGSGWYPRVDMVLDWGDGSAPVTYTVYNNVPNPYYFNPEADITYVSAAQTFCHQYEPSLVDYAVCVQHTDYPPLHASGRTGTSCRAAKWGEVRL